MCSRTAETLATLNRAPCLQIATGHSLWSAGPVSFCFLCGAYSSKRAHKLSGVCSRGIGDSTALYRRQRLRAGFHPLTNERLGEARREDNLQEEWELYASVLEEDGFDGDEGGPTNSEA